MLDGFYYLKLLANLIESCSNIANLGFDSIINVIFLAGEFSQLFDISILDGPNRKVFLGFSDNR